MRDDQRNTPISAPPHTISAGCDDDVSADQLAPPHDQGGEEHAEQRLRGDQRADDGHAPAVEGFEECGVGQAPEQTGQGETAERPAARAEGDAAPSQREEIRGHHRAPVRIVAVGGELRIDGRVVGEPANDVVARGEEERRAESEHETDSRRCSGRSRSPASARRRAL